MYWLAACLKEDAVKEACDVYMGNLLWAIAKGKYKRLDTPMFADYLKSIRGDGEIADSRTGKEVAQDVLSMFKRNHERRQAR